MANELKPCPLCGRAPKSTQREAAPDMPHRFVAFRTCHGGGYSAHVHVHVYGTGNTPTEAWLDADEKWNTRHSSED